MSLCQKETSDRWKPFLLEDVTWKINRALCNTYRSNNTRHDMACVECSLCFNPTERDFHEAVRYLKAVENAQILAVRPVLGRIADRGHLRSVHAPDQAEGGADGLVDVQQGEPSLTLSLSHQEFAAQPIGLRRDGQRLGTCFQPAQQHTLLIQAERCVAGRWRWAYVAFVLPVLVFLLPAVVSAVLCVVLALRLLLNELLLFACENWTCSASGRGRVLDSWVNRTIAIQFFVV